MDSPPKEPKPHCDGCDKWHDTQEEVSECIAKKKESLDTWQKKATEMNKKENPAERVDKLESDMSEIKDMLAQLLSKSKLEV